MEEFACKQVCVSEVPVIINYFFGNKTIKLMLKKKHKDLLPQKILKETCEGCEDSFKREFQIVFE